MNSTVRTTQPLVDEYQERFVRNVRRVIDTNWLRKRPAIRILDMGCDTSGRQMAHLAALTRGEVVGINIPEHFPTQEAIQTAGPRTKLIRMNGLNLRFPNASFDLVISANVMEHVSDPAKYISEAARVLKPSGIAYFETAPVWTGPRGHHIHPDMITENCPGETQFRDDGSVIPDWSHLSFSESQMRSHLESLLQPVTVEYIMWYLYSSGDLNKTQWNVIQAFLRSSFPCTSISTWGTLDTNEALMPHNRGEQYSVSGFSIVARKRPANPVTKRLFWRLRQAGF